MVWNGTEDSKLESDGVRAVETQPGSIQVPPGRNIELHRGLKARHITMIGMRL